MSWLLGQQKLDDLNRKCEERADAGNPCERGSVNSDGVKRYERLTNPGLGLTVASALAAGVLKVALKRKWVAHELDSRALEITRFGTRELRSRLGLRLEF